MGVLVLAAMVAGAGESVVVTASTGVVSVVGEVAPAVMPTEQAKPEAQVETPVVAATNAVHEIATNAVPEVVVSPPAITPPPEPTVIIPEEDVACLWKGSKWQIGARYTQFKLDETHRGKPSDNSYFGSITGLREVQDDVPNKLYAQYRIMDSACWVGIAYDHIKAETLDFVTVNGVETDTIVVGDDGTVGDGAVDVQGAILYLHAAWDNASRFTPYAQLGVGYYQPSFEPNSTWGENGMRRVDLNGSVTGFECAGGLNIRIYKTLSADLFARMMKIDDITGEWYSARGAYHGGSVVLPLSYTAYGAGLNYRF